MAEWTMYFHPKCASCRKALDLLNYAGIQPRLIEYLRMPPSVQELQSLAQKLGIDAENLIRKKEPLYAQLKLERPNRSNSEWLELISKNPQLLQRPIVVKDNRGLIARPAERVNFLLKQGA